MRNGQVFDKGTLRAKLREKIARGKAQEEESHAPEITSATPSPEMTISKMRFAETLVKSPERNVKVGQLISLCRTDSSSELAAAVVRMEDGMWIELLRPVPEITFGRGEKIRIEAWDEDGSYTFHSIVQEAVSDPRPGLRISKPTTGFAVQRKKSDRSRWSVPFSFSVLSAEDSDINGKTVPYARTQEISLGGMAFESNLPLSRGDQLKVRLTLLPSPHRLKLMAKVIRSTPTAAAEASGTNRVTLQFSELAPAEYNNLLLFLAKNDPGSESDIPWVG